MSQRITFNLIENAFDYVLSAAEHAKLGSPRAWKYAVLHLAAGIELLLKARLVREHWALIFLKADEASNSAMRSGDFVSVDFKTACSRLNNIGGVAIAKESYQHLESLRKLRNRIQHFAIDVEAPQAKSLLAKGIRFFMDFCEAELEDEFEARRDDEISGMVEQLRGFKEFVEERLASISSGLQRAYELAECPRCWQLAVEIGDGDPHCLFCLSEVDAEELARQLATEADLETCPSCGKDTFVFRIYNNERAQWVCTSCGDTADRYEHCPRCGGGFSGDAPVCCTCWEYMNSKD